MRSRLEQQQQESSEWLRDTVDAAAVAVAVLMLLLVVVLRG